MKRSFPQILRGCGWPQPPVHAQWSPSCDQLCQRASSKSSKREHLWKKSLSEESMNLLPQMIRKKVLCPLIACMSGITTLISIQKENSWADFWCSTTKNSKWFSLRLCFFGVTYVHSIPFLQTFKLLFSALQLIVFYKWVKLLLHRIDKKVYWEEIKTVLSDLIKRKLKGDCILSRPCACFFSRFYYSCYFNQHPKLGLPGWTVLRYNFGPWFPWAWNSHCSRVCAWAKFPSSPPLLSNLPMIWLISPFSLKPQHLLIISCMNWQRSTLFKMMIAVLCMSMISQRM